MNRSSSRPPHNRSRRSSFQHRDDGRRVRGKPRHQVEEKPTEPPKCSVCETEPQPKYKCPKCRATYCSIACCRKHKESNCEATSTKPAISSKYCSAAKLASTMRPAKRSRTDSHDDAEEGWKITDEMKEKMNASAWIKSELEDPGLKHLLSELYQASDVVVSKRYGVDATTAREQLLDSLKQNNPHFKLFIDKLLLLTGVLKAEGDRGNIEELLSRPSIQEHLVLSSATTATLPPPLRSDDEPDGDGSLSSGDSSPSSSSSVSSSESDCDDL